MVPRRKQPSEEERFESLMRNDLNEKMASLYTQMNKLQNQYKQSLASKQTAYATDEPRKVQFVLPDI